jgi:catechol 2,3-dioxygenase-like lactoylglutathione lyase family enzyme
MAGSALAARAALRGTVQMPTALDHILLGCNDLDRGIAFVEQRIGVRAAFGGVHPGRGTRNALLSLGEQHYLEIIAPDPAQSGAPDTFGLRTLTEPHLVTWAAHPGNLDEFAAHLRTADLAFDGPTPGSRKRPDGKLLQWKTLTLRDNLGGLLPFFIEWNVDTIHPSVDAPRGGRLAGLSLFAPEPEMLAPMVAKLDLGLTVARGTKSELRAFVTSGDDVFVFSSAIAARPTDR